MNEHKGALAVLPSGHTPPPLLPHQQTSESTLSQWTRNVQTHCDRTGTQTRQHCYENALTLNTAHPQLSLGLETPPGALPVPSHCHLLAPARGWSPTFWLSASRIGDVSGGREGCPGHKGQAGLSHHRSSHGCPQGATGGGTASPPASSEAEQGHGWAEAMQAQHPLEKPGCP